MAKFFFATSIYFCTMNFCLIVKYIENEFKATH